MVNEKSAHGTGAGKGRVLLLCWLAYAISYLGRTNLSIALEPMLGALGISKAYGGLIGTSFFWTYALGQVFSGLIGAKVREKTLVITGLTGAALCNAAISLCGDPSLIFPAWSLNGFFLSLVWPPIVRILSNWFSREEYNSISVSISASTTVGVLVSWLVSGFLVEYIGWPLVFLSPAIVLAVYSVILLCFLPDAGKKTDKNDGNAPEPPPAQKKLLSVLFSQTILVTAVICFVQGAIKESVNLWAPTIFLDVSPTKNSLLISGFSIVIPIFSTAGIFLSGVINKRFGCHAGRTLRLMTIASFLISMLLPLAGSFLPGLVAVISLMMALLCGINSLITVFIPMEYAKYGLASQVAGLLNFIVYAGAAVGAWATGFWGGNGWNPVYLSWILLGLLGAAAGIYLSRRKCAN